MTITLTEVTPAIVQMDEALVINKFKTEHVGSSCWCALHLQEWLEDQGLSDYEASNYTDHLLDYMFENELGYEFGGITPWCGEGYIIY